MPASLIRRGILVPRTLPHWSSWPAFPVLPVLTLIGGGCNIPVAEFGMCEWLLHMVGASLVSVRGIALSDYWPREQPRWWKISWIYREC